MQMNELIFNELVKRGYSLYGKTKVWDVSNSKFWYLTPELARGFLNLRKYAPYKIRVVDDEIRLIKQHVPKIIAELKKNKFNLVDLGPGDGIKAEVVIKSLPRNIKIRYCPVDISQYYLKKASERIKELNSAKIDAVKSFISDFFDSDQILGLLKNSEYPVNLALLLGETISHYDIHDLLFTLSRNMIKGDYLIIGNGMRKGKRFEHLEKYRHPIFNAWFIHIMKGLGFKENELKFDVRFTHKRLEGFYHILVDKKIKYKGKSVQFKKGDEIIVGIQYKYFEKELKRYCSMYFSDVQLFKNKTNEYCLILCKK